MDHHHHSTMDHSTMDHSTMDHDLDSNAMRRCSMNMIFNWDATGTCIVFKRFYVSGTSSLIIYMILLFLLSIGYEYMRLAASRYDSMTRIKLGFESNSKRNGKRNGGSDSPPPPVLGPNRTGSSSSLHSNDQLDSFKAWGKVVVPRHLQITRSLFYVVNIAVSFFLMLVIMTYNAQIIGAVLAGAFVGHFIFHRELSYEEIGKGMACH
ncbi:Ctr copper transporter family-domain-containing protein [Melampsora americana]|nr:Ctr copper transporter family-domain-containing protein [Melampsora americana]